MKWPVRLMYTFGAIYLLLYCAGFVRPFGTWYEPTLFFFRTLTLCFIVAVHVVLVDQVMKHESLHTLHLEAQNTQEKINEELLKFQKLVNENYKCQRDFDNIICRKLGLPERPEL